MCGVGDVGDHFVRLFVWNSFVRVDEICGDQDGSVEVWRHDVGCAGESEGAGYVRVVPDGKGKTAALLDLTDTPQQRLSAMKNLVVWKMVGTVVQRHQPAVGAMSDALRGRRGSWFAHEINDGVLLRVEPDLRVEFGQ